MSDNTKPTWKNTLYPHAYFGHIHELQRVAKRVGYKYLCWNGVIHDADTLVEVSPRGELQSSGK